MSKSILLTQARKEEALVLRETPLVSSTVLENERDVEDVEPHLFPLSNEIECNLSIKTPYKLTIDLYKERCNELETELVHQHAATASKNLEIETLKTKVAMLIEFCKLPSEEDTSSPGFSSFSSGKLMEESRMEKNKESVLSPTAPLPPSPAVIRLVLRCAELEAALHAKQQSREPEIILHARHTVANTSPQPQRAHPLAGPELLALLRSACRQLEEARRVGSQLLARKRKVVNLKF
jgi:hypothetical protein